MLASSIEHVRAGEYRTVKGTVAALRGMTVDVDELPLPVGSIVRLEAPGAERRTGSIDALRGEVIGFHGPRSVVMLLGHAGGVKAGMRVVGEHSAPTVGAGESLLGRVIDGLGRPADGRPLPSDLVRQPLHRRPPGALARKRITEPLATGLRAIDGFLTLGRGQRIGIFSAAGVGKSTLLGTIARNTSADVNVIGLIGERGREVRDFIEGALGDEGLRRSVVVVATGDESPLLRQRAALVATAVAEHFRDRGADVMLMMDSITRFAQAARQIGLAAGEAPATRGYTPSVFAAIPSLLERAGSIEGGGSITGLYAVLVEGDDLNEPVSDTARGVLDGHIVLSRRLATRGHFPAIDVLQSISRLADEVCDRHQVQARRAIVRLLAAYAESEELINIGAYARGANPECDVAIAMKDRLFAFLRQSRDEKAEFPITCRTLLELSGAAEHVASRLSQAGGGGPAAAGAAQPAGVGGARR